MFTEDSSNLESISLLELPRGAFDNSLTQKMLGLRKKVEHLRALELRMIRVGPGSVKCGRQSTLSYINFFRGPSVSREHRETRGVIALSSTAVSATDSESATSVLGVQY